MKDFDSWNQTKKNLETSEVLPVFHEREIWWCSLGYNIGDEEDGKTISLKDRFLLLENSTNESHW